MVDSIECHEEIEINKTHGIEQQTESLSSVSALFCLDSLFCSWSLYNMVAQDTLRKLEGLVKNISNLKLISMQTNTYKRANCLNNFTCAHRILSYHLT